MSLTNIDDLLAGIEPVIESRVEPESTSDSMMDDSTSLVEEPIIVDIPKSDTSETTESKEDKESKTTDDYGQEIAKKERVYTQAEVDAKLNEAMRDRNNRGEWAKQEAERKRQEQPVTNPISEDGDDWESQLESFVDQTISKREQKHQELQWQEQVQRDQANFEIKFNSGASKYQDFEQVVSGKALTPQMVIATRGMDNPAAFIYAAAKTQSMELERISKINDHMTQAVELGKLEERMRRVKSASSGAPKPINTIKGDAPSNATRPKNVDDILRQEEDARIKARR